MSDGFYIGIVFLPTTAYCYNLCSLSEYSDYTDRGVHFGGSGHASMYPLLYMSESSVHSV